MAEKKYSEDETSNALNLSKFKLLLAQYKRAVHEQMYLQESTSITKTVTRILTVNELIMSKNGPIIVIEDDHDDQLLLSIVFKKLGYINKVFYFSDGQQALDHLQDISITPFLILSDINMPKLDGFALRDKIQMNAALQIRCIPYLFFSTATSQEMVINAYSLSAQGFFTKQTTMSELEKTISVIMEYWKRCSSPNNF